MNSDTVNERVERLERSLEKLKKDLRRCVEHPKNEFYPYFPQLVLADQQIALSLSGNMLTVTRNGTVVGSIVLY